MPPHLLVELTILYPLTKEAPSQNNFEISGLQVFNGQICIGQKLEKDKIFFF